MPAETPAPATDITDQILNAPEELWRRLRAALNVDTREEAVQVVSTDERAAELARSILGGVTAEEPGVLTKRATPAASFLTQGARAPSSAADVLYSRQRRGGLQL